MMLKRIFIPTKGERYVKNDRLRGVFGVYRRYYRNGKPAGFEKVVLDKDGNYRWMPVKGQDTLFSGMDRK